MNFFQSMANGMPSTLSLGLLWGVMTLGVFLTYRILDFADLTVDGSFALGGATAAALTVAGLDPFLSTALAFFAGMAAGGVTALLHTKLKIPGLLASILTQIALYSVNLHVMGKANLSFPMQFTENGKIATTIFARLPSFGLGEKSVIALYGLLIVLLVVAALWWYLSTERGITIRATGNNERMSRALGISTDRCKLVCLMLSNGLVAMSGALIAQNNKVATLDMGTGCIVFGLAAVIIGDVIFRQHSLHGQLLAVVGGSVLYRVIQSAVLIMNWPPEDFKLLSAVLVAFALALPVISQKGNALLIRMGLKKAPSLFPRDLPQEQPRRAMSDQKSPDVSSIAPDVNGTLVLSQISKAFHIGTVNQKCALWDVSLTMKPGDFVTVIGGNGAGKSTLLNTIAGVYTAESGTVTIGQKNVTRLSEDKRASLIGRVFQDPMMGTASGMTIEENLSIAMKRGSRRTFRRAIHAEDRQRYRELLKKLDLGLENRLKSRVGLLSGGQRQALTLLMATLTRPQLLLLDEHTAALDPKTSRNVLELTNRMIRQQGLTAMMVTHNMRDALQYGNRIIMMDEGKIILDIDGSTKKGLTAEDLLGMFGKASGSALTNDRMLLS